jgi:hypothetical protein
VTSASYKRREAGVLLIEGGGKQEAESQLHLPTIKPTVYEYDDLERIRGVGGVR